MNPPPPQAVRQAIIRLDDPPDMLQEYADGSHTWDSRLVATLGTNSTSIWMLTGMRLRLHVPQGATILAAFLSMICAETPSSQLFPAGQPTQVDIGAEVTDDAAPYPYYEGEFGPSASVLASRARLGLRM